jgi:ABC-type transport system substrate-binding protein
MEGWRVLTATNDGLLAYERVGGPAGVSLVPDLASALPDVSADGLTYRFPLRKGIRYSTGDPVRPEDFRRAIERAVVMHQAGSLYSAIEGTSACTIDPPTCDLADGIEVDARSVTFHLTMAYAVPGATPFEDQGLNPLPATGPYMIDEATTDGLEIVRNPEFGEWSGAAQPDGFVDAISWRFNEAPEAAYDRLTADELDVMIVPPRQDDLDACSPRVRIKWWNRPPRRPSSRRLRRAEIPFDDVRVRRAVNYAIDRDRVVAFLGRRGDRRARSYPTFPVISYCRAQGPGRCLVRPRRGSRPKLVDAAVNARVTVAVNGGLPSAVETMTYHRGPGDWGCGRAGRVRSVGAYFSSSIRCRGHPAGAPDTRTCTCRWISDYQRGNSRAAISCDFGYANTAGYCDEELDTRMERP